MAYLHILRPANLFLIVLAQCLIKFAIFPAFDTETALTTGEFGLLVLASVLIAAAGNVINDINDVEIDRVNKPDRVLVSKKVSEKTAYNYYLLLNIAGVITGFILANSLGKPSLAAIFIVVSALLYMYSSQIKAMLVFGNLLVSLLVAISLLVVVLFDIYPAINDTITSAQSKSSGLVLHYAIFAFVLNFIREIVKDLEDINGDRKGEMQTLAIVLGRTRTTRIVFLLSILTIVGIVIYMYTFIYSQQIMVLYFLLLIVAPLLYFCIRCWGAEKKHEYAFLSHLLKIVMLTGMLSMLGYKYF